MTSAGTGRDATVPGEPALLLPGADCEDVTPLTGGSNGRIAEPALFAGFGGGFGMYSPGAVLACPAPAEPADGVVPPPTGGAPYGLGGGGE